MNEILDEVIDILPNQRIEKKVAEEILKNPKKYFNAVGEYRGVSATVVDIKDFWDKIPEELHTGDNFISLCSTIQTSDRHDRIGAIGTIKTISDLLHSCSDDFKIQNSKRVFEYLKNKIKYVTNDKKYHNIYLMLSLCLMDYNVKYDINGVQYLPEISDDLDLCVFETIFEDEKFVEKYIDVFTSDPEFVFSFSKFLPDEVLLKISEKRNYFYLIDGQRFTPIDALKRENFFEETLRVLPILLNEINKEDLQKKYSDFEEIINSLFKNIDKIELEEDKYQYFYEIINLLNEEVKNDSVKKEIFYSSLLQYFPSNINDTILIDKTIEELIKMKFPDCDEEKITDITEIYNFFRNLDPKLKKLDGFYRYFIFGEAVKLDEKEIKLIEQRYASLLKIHKDTSDSVSFEFLRSDIFDLFNSNQLGRIVLDKELQSKLLKYKDNTVIVKLIEYVNTNSSNWVVDINNIFINIERYQELIEQIENENEYQTLLQTSERIEELDKFNENLLRILTSDAIYFRIPVYSFEDVKNFEKNSIASYNNVFGNGDNYVDKIVSENYDTSMKKDAFLRINFGINIKQAENLVEKYGADVDKIREYIDLEKESNIQLYIAFIERLKQVLYMDDKSFSQDEVQLSADKERFLKLPNCSQIESAIINIYEKCYRSVLYSPQETKDEIIIAEYNGQTVPVYNIDPKSEFYMLARSEGAYTGWREPENFLEELMRPNIAYHGNCKSFISNDMLGLARPKGPIYGYSNIAENSFLLQAPWDIFSDDANTAFSSASIKWNECVGIQFRTPREMINNTRHSHNEFVSERLIETLDVSGYTKDKPDYVIFIKETKNENYEVTEKWRMTKKAAAQLGVPIVILDKEAIIENEFEKHEH